MHKNGGSIIVLCFINLLELSYELVLGDLVSCLGNIRVDLELEYYLDII